MSLDPDQLVAALPGLQRYALMLAGDMDAAADLVQDTVVVALARGAGFRGDSSLATWLHRILYSRFVDSHRRRQARPVPIEDMDSNLTTLWNDHRYTVDPATIVAAAQTSGDLKDSLARLPDIYRSALLLHDVEGWTAAEIAAVHEIGLSAAKQRIRRGRAMLVSALDDLPMRRLATKGVPMHCWDAREQVGAYLDGDLGQADRARLEDHLSRCPTCPGLYAALVGVKETLNTLRDRDNVVPATLANRIRDLTASDDLNRSSSQQPSET